MGASAAKLHQLEHYILLFSSSILGFCQNHFLQSLSPMRTGNNLIQNRILCKASQVAVIPRHKGVVKSIAKKKAVKKKKYLQALL